MKDPPQYEPCMLPFGFSPVNGKLDSIFLSPISPLSPTAFDTLLRRSLSLFSPYR